jgi:uncharacterized membrane protein YgaE (UPF0421/DUF939 family)
VLRTGAAAAANRLRANVKPILLMAASAGIAWFIAHDLLGHQAPFFAAISALVVSGLAAGQSARRAIELTIGQAVGILVADAIITLIGTGAWQVTLVVILAMSTAILLISAGPLLYQQAAVSAALIATIQPPQSGLSTLRFVDALVGGGVAVLLNVVIFPTNPLAVVRREVSPLARELAATLRDIAGALEHRDGDAAEDALARARGLDEHTRQVGEALDSSRDALRYSPIYRTRRGHAFPLRLAAERLDLAVRNVRVLARRAVRAVETGDDVPLAVIRALCRLADAVEQLDDRLGDPEGSGDVEATALDAARLATDALAQRTSLSVTVLIGQVRSMVVDLLSGAGMELGDALAAIEALEPASTAR